MPCYIPLIFALSLQEDERRGNPAEPLCNPPYRPIILPNDPDWIAVP